MASARGNRLHDWIAPDEEEANGPAAGDDATLASALDLLDPAEAPRNGSPPLTSEGLMFFVTSPAACPYLAGQQEQKLVAMLDRQTARHFDVLNLAGFRRSHAVAYRPVCAACNACRALRVKAQEFTPNRSQRKLKRRATRLVRRFARAESTAEHYALFHRYVDRRHEDGDMALMGPLEFREMVEETAVSTGLMEWREPDSGALVAACLIDLVSDGLSMVYSYFDVDHAIDGLGSFMILDCLEVCRAHRLPHLYLGYWVKDAPKMAYKAAFRPAEQFHEGRWRSLPERKR